MLTVSSMRKKEVKGKNNMRWMGVCGWVGYDGVWECVAVGRDVAVWLCRLGLAKHPSPVVSFFVLKTSFCHQR